MELLLHYVWKHKNVSISLTIHTTAGKKKTFFFNFFNAKLKIGSAFPVGNIDYCMRWHPIG